MAVSAVNNGTEARPEYQRWTRSGTVVSDQIVAVLVIVAMIGAATGQLFVTALCGLVLVVAMVSRLRARLALVEVNYHCAVPLNRLVVGESFHVSLTIENRKPLPLPWLQIAESLPDGLELERETESHMPPEKLSEFGRAAAKSIRETTGFGPYERVTFHHRLRAAHRGIYSLGSTRITSGNILGFYQAQLDSPKRPAELIVYPSWRHLPAFDLPIYRPMADSQSPTRLVDDPTRPASLREYRHGDPAHRIDWKATARRGEVFVRTYDSSRAQQVVILLECDTSIQRWRIHPDVLKAAVSAAASVAVRCIDLGFSVGLISNGNMAGTLAPPVVPTDAGPNQLAALMTALAGANPFTSSGLEKLVARYGPEALPHGASVVYVAGAMGPPTMAYVADLGRRSHGVTALYVGDGDPPTFPGLTIQDYRAVFNPDEAHFNSGGATCSPGEAQDA